MCLIFSFLHGFIAHCRAGLREGCPILRQIYARHCIVLISDNNTVQKHNNEERSKTIRNLTMPCINLSEYWTSMAFGFRRPRLFTKTCHESISGSQGSRKAESSTCLRRKYEFVWEYLYCLLRNKDIRKFLLPRCITGFEVKHFHY